MSKMQDYFDKANEAFYAGDFDTAIHNYKLGIFEEGITVYNITLIRDAYNKMSQAYYNIGQVKLAYIYNEKVLELDPKSEYGLHNKKFFESVMKEEE